MVILLFVLIIVVGIPLAIAVQPNDFQIKRSAVVNAPPDQVFSVINDLHRWSEWSPWERHDPEMKKTFTGPGSGPGASYEWNGNNKVGEGRLTIVDSKPNQEVDFKLEFVRPFKCANEVTFTMEPSGPGTKVSWIMDGHNTFIGKAFHLCMNMDKMVGKDFELGLKNLDEVVRSHA